MWNVIQLFDLKKPWPRNNVAVQQKSHCILVSISLHRWMGGSSKNIIVLVKRDQSELAASSPVYT